MTSWKQQVDFSKRRVYTGNGCFWTFSDVTESFAKYLSWLQEQEQQNV